MTVLEPGDYIGRYEIQAVVGEGGFGKVYRAWDAELERLVAIKALLSEGRDPVQHAAYRERFKMEQRVQGQFQHLHIVSVYDLVQQNGDEYLIEEYVAGGTLAALIKQNGPLSPERAVQIGVQMCQAIAAAWERDIVHRDIKPSNILLTDDVDGHAKLTDFGVAQIGQMSQRTQSDNHHPGTPAYMSPEQERGYGYLDERSDLYALGLVLYKALTGKSFKRERVPLRQLAPEVPKALEQVVMRTLAQDPDERYQSAAEFETALRRSLKRPWPPWQWWVGGILVLLALTVAGGWSLRPALTRRQPTATSEATPSPSATFTPSTPTVVATRTPMPNPTRTSRVSPTPTVTITATSRATQNLVVSAPRLLSPVGATAIKSSQPTLRWEGELPDSDYGFRVSLRHGSGATEYTSPVLDSTHWQAKLPGDAVGEWRWSVAIVRRDRARDAVAHSDEWTFYYSPFDGEQSPPAPTPHSPLPSPISPLAPPSW